MFILMSLGALLAFQPTEPGSGTVKRELQVGNMKRTYLLHVPAKLPAGPAPLVLVFHLNGGDALFTERDTQFSPLADREGFIVAYPQGIENSWNDGRGNISIPAQRLNIDDLAFALALMEDIGKVRSVDPKRIYSTGISNGGFFSHYLAAKHADRIAAIAPVAGGMSLEFSERFKPSQPVAALIIHGTADPVVPYAGGVVVLNGERHGEIIPTESCVKKWVEADGCGRKPVVEELPDKDPNDGCRVKKFTYGQGKDGTAVVHLRIEGGGHTWPGGTQYRPKDKIGLVCRDFSASEAIWAFFKAHPKR